MINQNMFKSEREKQVLRRNLRRYETVLDDLKEKAIVSPGENLAKAFVNSYFMRKLGHEYTKALSSLAEVGKIEYIDNEKIKVN